MPFDVPTKKHLFKIFIRVNPWREGGYQIDKRKGSRRLFQI